MLGVHSYDHIDHLFQNYALSTGVRWKKNDFFKANDGQNGF